MQAMTLTTATHESVNAADMLARQRHAFLSEDVPTLKQRKARLAKLRAAKGYLCKDAGTCQA